MLLAAAAAGLAVGVGDTREDVLRELGKPASAARRGDREILVYPKGGRVELAEGRVVDVKGPLPEPIAATAAPAAVPTTPPVTAAPPPPSTPAVAVKSSPTTKAAPSTANPATPPIRKDTAETDDEEADSINPAVAANALGDQVEKMNTAWGEKLEPEPSTAHVHGLSLMLGLIIRFGITVLALKVAFKYWEMDAFWKGIFVIAGIDAALHGLFELLGPATGGFTQMHAVESGVPGLVMIYTINRFCFNKRLQNAVVTAASVKVFATLCHVFAVVALLNMAFG